MNQPIKQMHVVQLRSGAAQGTAISATDTSLLATDLKDARIRDVLHGVLVLFVSEADGADADETYVVKLVGRASDAGAYEDLAEVVVTRGSPGVYAASVPTVAPQLNLAAELEGTTPSLAFGAVLVGTTIRYLPGAGATVIAS